MKDQALQVEYFTTIADDKPGVGADLGKRLATEGVNLLAILAFPVEPGKTQVDLVPEDPDAFVSIARRIGLAIDAPKMAFLVQGTDRAGAMADVLGRLGSADINVRASCGVASGGNRYGVLLWVRATDVQATARALGAQMAARHHA
jgi:predicted amino acid-binding ACT domain protein